MGQKFQLNSLLLIFYILSLSVTIFHLWNLQSSFTNNAMEYINIPGWGRRNAETNTILKLSMKKFWSHYHEKLEDILFLNDCKV